MSQSNSVDLVNHPPHYISGGLETIDVIEAFTKNLTGLEAVCTANVIKYICRWKHKNGLQDLEKARWYLEKLIKTVSNRDQIRMEYSTNPSGEPCAKFSIDRSKRVGALNATHETTLYFYPQSGDWSGDEIGPSGWVDLDEEEIESIVDEYGLMDIYETIMKENDR